MKILRGSVGMKIMWLEAGDYCIVDHPKSYWDKALSPKAHYFNQ